MGAHFRLPIHSMSWDEIKQVVTGNATHPYCKFIWRIWTDNPAGKLDLRQPLALIIGGEAEGASEQARKLANQKISIPMDGNMESLNAGVAGSQC